MSREARRTFRVASLTLEQLNFALGLIADRMDELEGRRGTPQFKADVNMGSNKISSLGNAVASADALPLGQADSAIDGAVSSATDPILKQDSKGALLVHNGTGLTQLNVGPDGSKLTADSSETTGIKWAPYYESDEQTITSAGALTLAHGLGTEPLRIQALIVCKTAEGGYSVGDKVFVNSFVGGEFTGSLYGFSAVPDSTNINIRFGNYSSVFYVIVKNTGSVLNITNANWKLIIRAWA